MGTSTKVWCDGCGRTFEVPLPPDTVRLVRRCGYCDGGRLHVLLDEAGSEGETPDDHGGWDRPASE